MLKGPISVNLTRVLVKHAFQSHGMEYLVPGLGEAYENYIQAANRCQLKFTDASSDVRVLFVEGNYSSPLLSDAATECLLEVVRAHNESSGPPIRKNYGEGVL